MTLAAFGPRNLRRQRMADRLLIWYQPGLMKSHLQPSCYILKVSTTSIAPSPWQLDGSFRINHRPRISNLVRNPTPPVINLAGWLDELQEHSASPLSPPSRLADTGVPRRPCSTPLSPSIAVDSRYPDPPMVLIEGLESY